MKKYTFTAKIVDGDGGGAGVLFPYDTEKEFATKGKVPIKATFNGVPYTGSLIKYGFPQHTLHLPKAIREQLGKVPGDTVDVVLWKDEEERILEVPAPFEEQAIEILESQISDEELAAQAEAAGITDEEFIEGDEFVEEEELAENDE